MKKLFDKILKDYLDELSKADKVTFPNPELLQRQGDLVTLIREHLNNYEKYEQILYVQNQRRNGK
jgi:hypothetical protein